MFQSAETDQTQFKDIYESLTQEMKDGFKGLVSSRLSAGASHFNTNGRYLTCCKQLVSFLLPVGSTPTSSAAVTKK